MFEPTMPLWELFARGTLTYFTLIFLVRVLPKRKTGHLSPNDMLFLIVIGGMGTDAIMGGSTSLLDILLMIGLIVGWGYLFDIIEARSPFVQSLLRDRQTPLIEQGSLNKRNMRREMVTEEELMSVLREAGIEDISQVHSACLEADGEISVIAEGGRKSR